MPGRRSSPPPDLERLLDSQAVAELLGVPSRSLDRWAHVGSGPAYIRVGRHRRYAPRDVRAWLDERRHGGRP